MEQLDFLKNGVVKRGEDWRLFIDGASRNNPGPAGAGIYLVRNNEPILKKGLYLGIKTNNQAEYIALILGLSFLKREAKNIKSLLIFSDSELLVRQINGIYKVKSPDIKKLYLLAIKLLKNFNYLIEHVPRNKNKEADKLANLGIDQKIKVPRDLLIDGLAALYDEKSSL